MAALAALAAAAEAAAEVRRRLPQPPNVRRKALPIRGQNSVVAKQTVGTGRHHTDYPWLMLGQKKIYSAADAYSTEKGMHDGLTHGWARGRSEPRGCNCTGQGLGWRDAAIVEG